METPTLPASLRDIREKPKRLRLQGKVPAIYYGRSRKSLPLILDYSLLRKVYEKAGANTIIELCVDNQKFPVLIHDIQFDPVKDTISHVDFLHVDMAKEVTTRVGVKTTGVSSAVKDFGGILVMQKHEITIKCLPKDLIHEIVVDISDLADFHTAIHVKHLKVPPNIKVLDNPDDTVINVRPPRAEEEEKPAVEEAVGVVSAVPSGAPGAIPSAPAAGAPSAPQGTSSPGAGGGQKTPPSQKEGKK